MFSLNQKSLFKFLLDKHTQTFFCCCCSYKAFGFINALEWHSVFLLIYSCLSYWNEWRPEAHIYTTLTVYIFYHNLLTFCHINDPNLFQYLLWSFSLPLSLYLHLLSFSRDNRNDHHHHKDRKCPIASDCYSAAPKSCVNSDWHQIVQKKCKIW